MFLSLDFLRAQNVSVIGVEVVLVDVILNSKKRHYGYAIFLSMFKINPICMCEYVFFYVYKIWVIKIACESLNNMFRFCRKKFSDSSDIQNK